MLAPALALVLLSLHLDASAAGGGFVIYPGSESGSGPVVFSHRFHEKNRIPCRKCHAAGSGRALVITMQDIRQGRACGSCHGRTDCAGCHMPPNDIVFKLNRMDPVNFSHTRHLSADSGRKISIPAGLSCSDCHPIPFERSRGSFAMQAPHESGGCAQCHNGRKRSQGMPAAFAASTRCLTCHKPSDQ